SSRRRHTRFSRDWSSDVCSSDLYPLALGVAAGMWLGDHHWASDILSGALLGEAIGSAAGRSFASDPVQPTIALVPREDGWLLVRSEERRVGQECRSQRVA